MDQINIHFDSEYSDWLEEINKKLDVHNVYRGPSLQNVLLENIKKCVIIYLNKMGITVNNLSYDYRIMLVRNWAKENKMLSVCSNKTLWIYLEYFLDLQDYTECFDINLIKI